MAFLHRLLLYGSHHGYSVCCSVCRLSRGVPPPVVAIREITMVTVFVALFVGYPLAFLHRLLLYGKSSWLQCLLCLQVIPWHSFTGCCYTGSYHGYSVCCSAGYPLAFLHQFLLYRKSPWLQCLLLCLQVTLWRSSTSCATRKFSMVTVFVALFAGHPLAFLHQLLLYGKSPWLQHLLLCLQVIPWRSSTSCCYMGNHHGYSVCCSVCRLHSGVPPLVVAIWEITMVTAFVVLFAGYTLVFLQRLLLHRKSPWLQCLLFCLQVTLWHSSTSCCYTGNHHGYSVCCSVCRLSPGVPSLVVDLWEVSMVTVFALQVIPWHSFTGCCYTGSLHGYSVCCSVCRLPSGDPPPVVLHGNSPWLQCLLLCLQVIPWRSSTGCCYTGNHHGYSVCCSVCRLSPGVPPPVVAIREVFMVTAPVLHSVWYRNLLLQLR